MNERNRRVMKILENQIIKRFDDRYKAGYYDNDGIRPDYQMIRAGEKLTFIQASCSGFLDQLTDLKIDFDKYDKFLVDLNKRPLKPFPSI